MITLRALKRKSQRALPILQRHYGGSCGRSTEFYTARRGDNYHRTVVRCTCRTRRPYCPHQYHPLPGTLMIGWQSGWDSPDWEEQTLFEELCDRVRHEGRSQTMTDAEWDYALRMTRCAPIDYDAMAREMLA